MITDDKTATAYAKKYFEMTNMLANIGEFLETMPAPHEDCSIPGVDYAWLGSVNELHSQLTVASEICDELGE